MLQHYCSWLKVNLADQFHQNNISSVAYAFYEPVTPPADFFGPAALELETVLRNNGSLVHVDAARRGVWCFSLRRKDHEKQDAPIFAKTIESCGYHLSLDEENSFEPSSLAKNRGHVPNTLNTPSSSSSSSSNPLDMAFKAPSVGASAVTADLDAKALVAVDAKVSTTTTIREAYGHLISAVNSALASAFCAKTGATPLDSRTLLLPQRIQGESGSLIPILASLRAYLTTTGVLVVSLGLTPVDGLVSLSDHALPPLLGITVLAAPLGIFATCQAIAESEGSSDHSLAQSPDTQVSRLRPEREAGHWRSICTKLLKARNLPSPMSGADKWLSLQRVRRKPVEQGYDGKRTPMVNMSSPSMSWPSSLCFCKAFAKLSVTTGLTEVSPPTTDTPYDPLTNAKQWFLGSAERETLLVKKKQEKEALANQQVSVNTHVQPSSALSPLALHRPSNAGAPPGAMYPTPPDGVQTMVGFTPSVDGTMSSPGHVASTTAVVDVDTSMPIPGETFPDSWENPEPKREERSGSTFESENLFGDLGPDMFGDTDITDADFSFFDEEPGGMDMALDTVDLSSADRLLDMAQDFHHNQIVAPKPASAVPPEPSAPPVPVFTKPELKHARSSLNDQARRHTEPDLDRERPNTAKRQASPFNPDTVFKRIRASFDVRQTNHQTPSLDRPQPGSIFDKVDFGPGLALVNGKYHGRGRFSFSINEEQTSKPSTIDAPPTTSYLQRHGKVRRLLKTPPANVGELFARMANAQAMASQHPSPNKVDDPASDADEASLVSDLDDSSYESDEPISPLKAGVFRRRRLDDDEQSLATSFREVEYQDAASPNVSVDLPKFSKSEIDLPLTKYFADAEPIVSHVSLVDEDFIVAAQILTEQASTSTIGVAAETPICLQSKLSRRRELLSMTNLALQELRSVLPDWFEPQNECHFKPLIEVQDVPLLGQPTRLQPRPPGADQLKPSNPFQIPAPRLEMQRNESKLSVLPSAVSFWESLGLGPSNGTKDINAICIFPDSEGVSDDIMCFLDELQGAYESLKLGSFERMSATPDIPGGLLPYQVEKSNQASHSSPSILGTPLLGGLTRLSDVLSHLTVKDMNFVVFFVYPRDMPGSIVESCNAFHQLFERYKKLLLSSQTQIENDLVLQLVPLDFVASAVSVPAPSPLDYVRLAVETYDRCTLFEGSMPAPGIVLEQTIPRMIDFRLSTAPSASLLHENTCLHLAYAQSIDERWITVAWTNNRGSQQMTASYCLGRKGKSICTPFGEVAHEIWETTQDMISTWKVHWRIIITKCGVMEPGEIELWSSLAQAESRAAVTLTLMTVDTDPSLQLLPPEVKVSSNASAVVYTTPVSTPQASTVSPEQSGNPLTPSLRDATSAPTPGAPNENAPDSDADATLTDVTDQTWGAVLAHRLNNSTSLAELSPAIVSGYLIKKGGAKIEDPPAVMEVNVVHSEGNPRAYETLLREILTYFRGLGTLARARGMTDKETDVRPWHIAAAENGVRALYMLM